MTYEDDRQRQVRTGQAINLAVHIAANENIVNVLSSDPVHDVLERAHELLPSLLGFINAVQDGAVNTVEEVTTAEAVVNNVVRAFPGSQVEPVEQFQTHNPPPPDHHFAPEGHPVPNQSEPAPHAQPAPVPGVTDGDPETAALWQLYFSDPAAWWDNRNNKRNPRGPDFKHKDQGHALWIVGKKNPSWVAGQLAARA